LEGQLKLLDYGLLIPAQELKEIVKQEDKEGGRGRRSKSCMDEQRIQEIEEKVQNYLKESGALQWEEKPLPTRHVEAMRQSLIKECKQASKKCDTCSGGWHKVILYESRILYSLKNGTMDTFG
jgi:hypothetical protein